MIGRLDLRAEFAMGINLCLMPTVCKWSFYEQLRALIAVLVNGFQLRKIVCNLRRVVVCIAPLAGTSRRQRVIRTRVVLGGVCFARAC